MTIRLAWYICHCENSWHINVISSEFSQDLHIIYSLFATSCFFIVVKYYGSCYTLCKHYKSLISQVETQVGVIITKVLLPQFPHRKTSFSSDSSAYRKQRNVVTKINKKVRRSQFIKAIKIKYSNPSQTSTLPQKKLL